MLLQEPMQAVKSEMPESVIVVIDALDECDDGDASQQFLETLLKLAVDLPIKFFLTSRPEPAIREKMLTPGYSRSVLHLHDIEESIVEADIKKRTNWYPIDTEIGSQAKPADLDYWTYLKEHEGDWSDTSSTKPSEDAIKGAF
ncbi:hypothetical protein B0H14DRAFT_3451885 [Mycena olivaceomarginata]|nr:hypothetical protein B0H14DRAFT_3451885 [Mycena olivaceomarginata]